MKTLGRWLFRLFLVLLVLVVALILVKDALIKSYAEKTIREASGMDVHIGKLDIGLFTPTVHIEGFRLFNRTNFGGGPFVDLPELRVEYDFGAALERRLHLRLLRLNLTEAQVVKNQAGDLNVAELAALAAMATNRNQSIPFGGIDRLYVTFGRVKYLDLSNPKNNKDINVGLNNESATNLVTVADLNTWVTKTVVQRVLPQLLFQRGLGLPMPSIFSPGRSQPATRTAPAR